MSLIVTGSLAYDHIMDFQGHFGDHILPEKVHMINLSFLVRSLRKLRGGCATNIAYNLRLLGERPTILGTVGHDFEDYKAWLDERGIDTSGIIVVPDEFTASCFITTDTTGNQITGFYPGAMDHASKYGLSDIGVDPADVEMAIISPNAPQAMINYVRDFKEARVPYVYDPGQQIIALDGEQLLDGATGAQALIGNDYEIELFKTKAGRAPHDLVAEGRTPIVIITKGDQGSTIVTADGETHIAPAREQSVADPTGAGDAYRAGVIKGLVRGYSIEQMGKVASLAAVYVVEQVGTQSHSYAPGEFDVRYADNYETASILTAPGAILLPLPEVVFSTNGRH